MLAAPPDYQVKLEAFEGPLDLLLFLVRKEEVELWDIPIERITQQFLAYINSSEELDIQLAGEFIVMAATLIYIKSRRLLPEDSVAAAGEEGDEDALDPRLELIRRLIDYKRFKESAAHLLTRQAARLDVFLRPPPAPKSVVDVGSEPPDLLAAFHAMLRRCAARWPVRELERAQFTVSEKIDQLLAAVPEDPEASIAFESLFLDACSREEMVVTFLALLELMRLKRLRIRQEAPFATIYIFRAPVIAG